MIEAVAHIADLKRNRHYIDTGGEHGGVGGIVGGHSLSPSAPFWGGCCWLVGFHYINMPKFH
jgi:hypothetical protein